MREKALESYHGLTPPGTRVKLPSAVRRWLWRGGDFLYRWVHGLTDPAAEVGPILRVQVKPYRGSPLTLGDGSLILRGDPIGVIHLNNERVSALHAKRGGSRWAGLAFRRAFQASLQALAEGARTTPRYHAVRAFTTTTIFHQGTERAGFEVRPLSRPLLGRLVAAYERGLLIQFHPLGRRRPGRQRFAEARQIWISREELLRRYAPERSSLRDTHA